MGGLEHMAHHLRFAPEILARLGEELVPYADLGIMELVRNAYDADAKTCRLTLSNAKQPGGTLSVVDDGDGMTAEQLADGFLLIGKSSKSSETHTRSLRRRVGEKGLGRLAALRLGTRVSIRTRSRTNPESEHILTIDWKQVDTSEAVEDTPLTIETRSPTGSVGTTVDILGLRQGISERDAERLARSLLMLTGPFADQGSFQVACDTTEFDSLSRLITSDLLEWAEYRLVATLDSEGQASAALFNWRGEELFSEGHSQVGMRRYGRGHDKSAPFRFDTPEAKFEMWMFNLNPSASKEVRLAQQPTATIKTWLREVGGVHLYHRELRVQPYGDVGNDWLGINVRRAASPELRPSTNTSLGRVQVKDPDNLLQPKTDRSGFVDAPPFVELQEFVKRALDWAAEKRLLQREHRRAGAARKARDRVKEAETKFQNLLDAIAPSDPKAPALIEARDPAVLESFAAGAADVFDSQREEIQALREDLLLYRSLATVGTSTAVFAHEAAKPSSRIVRDVDTVRRRMKIHISDEMFRKHYEKLLDSSASSAQTLETFARLPLNLVKKSKREVGDIDVDVACPAVVDLFTRYLDERGIQVEFDLAGEGGRVRSTIADLESILSNLLVNAAHAFTRTDARRPTRVIRIRTRLVDEVAGKLLCMSVDDSGPGIVGIDLAAIWLPGKTTRDNGTGLGLTIVRDIVADLGGAQEARAHGELGGARIMIWLPVATAGGAGNDSGQSGGTA
ncbi:ATP-binding protein [Nocardia sp. NPDC002869]|uniref:sensor histidine kinase n=1 Tax=Nocardia sp. NPDC002869 TaxID=3161032 RepID=UPI00398CCE10